MRFYYFWFFFSCIGFLVLAKAQIDLNNPLAREIVYRSKVADIKSWMEPQQDPCDNFYNYACGKWKRINSATNSHVYSKDQFQEVSKGQQRKVTQLLNHTKTGDRILDKIRDFYESCLYVKNNRQEYKTSIKAMYKDYGEFSFEQEENDSLNASLPTWWTILAQIHRTYGKSSILSVKYRKDVKNNSRTVLYMSIPNFIMVEPDKKSQIMQFLMKFYDFTEKAAYQIYDELIDFEIGLMEGGTDARLGKTVEELLTLYNTEDLLQKYSELMNMEEFLKIALNTTKLPAQIYIYDQQYFDNLTDIITNSDPQTVRDYILWYLLDDFMFDDTTIADWDLWCSTKTKKYFGKYLDYTIYQQYRSIKYENDIYALWQEIKNAFRLNLQQNKYHWLTREVRDYALKKLEKMKLTINTNDDEDFETFFQGLNLHPHNYVLNLQNTLKRWEQQRHIYHQAQNNKKEHYDIEMAEVLAFTPVYNSLVNEVIMPVVLLQPYRLWHPLYPNVIKYATLGFLLAHEMIHGFDDAGRLFDAYGQTHNWWDNKSLTAFNDKRSCFQDQYHNFIYDGSQLAYSVSQTENIADNAAIKLSYQAYMSWLNKTGAENKLTNETFRNLSYNREQLFFITMAQLWCDDVHEDYKSSMANQDSHAPSMYRVIGVLSNFPKFSEVFHCKEGSFMNPVDKCEIY